MCGFMYITCFGFLCLNLVIFLVLIEDLESRMGYKAVRDDYIRLHVDFWV